jgi:serine/threonine protein kinase
MGKSFFGVPIFDFDLSPLFHSNPKMLPFPANTKYELREKFRFAPSVGIATVLAYDRVNFRNVVIKYCSSRNGMGFNILKNEAKMLTLAESPYVVKKYEEFLHAGALEGITYGFLVEEFCPGKDLLSSINEKGTMTEAEIRALAQWGLLAIKDLQDKNLIHSDLTLDNILITDGGYRLSDFQFAYTMDDEPGYAHGAKDYVALEHNTHRGFHINVWQLGVCLHAAFSGQYPFAGETIPEVAATIKKSGYRPPVEASLQLQEFLSDMLVPNYKHRSTVEQLLKHPFLRPE